MHIYTHVYIYSKANKKHQATASNIAMNFKQDKHQENQVCNQNKEKTKEETN